MLKNALIFAIAALLVGLSAPSIFSERAARPAAPSASGPVAPAAAAPVAAAAVDGGSDDREASIPADAAGQFHATAVIEGQEVAMIVDTGATVVALTADTAARLGVFADSSKPKWRMNTANGVSFVSPVTLRSVSVGAIEIYDVQAVVMAPGAGAANLLGASFLKRLASVEQRDGSLVLRQ